MVVKNPSSPLNLMVTDSVKSFPISDFFATKLIRSAVPCTTLEILADSEIPTLYIWQSEILFLYGSSDEMPT